MCVCEGERDDGQRAIKNYSQRRNDRERSKREIYRKNEFISTNLTGHPGIPLISDYHGEYLYIDNSCRLVVEVVTHDMVLINL